ncbi:type II secretion system F family protein [Ottowia sp. VDI28]|uniref:type II secretion system F family protein n=1 Tax=Ottowia sp. VDI28 TaxID=3133968 RepID=UPI003C2CF8C9
MTGLAPGVLVLSAIACVLLALALWLFARAKHKASQQSIDSNMQRSLEIQRDLRVSAPLVLPGASVAQALALNAQTRTSTWRRLEDRLGVAAWGIPPRALALLSAAALLFSLGTGVRGGVFMGVIAFALCILLGTFGIWWRMSRRRAKMLSQLPSFLDNVVRLISIGNSPHAAFQFATSNVPEPLSGALQDASASLSVSPDLGQAMAQLERTWGLPEFGLLAAVFRMSTRYGGRADLVLERVSAYIRDRQSAERELHALSAEVRLSAWILALLPIVVGAMIMFLNKGYFMRMWNDPAGHKLILMAAALQVFGSFLLYRLARLK